MKTPDEDVWPRCEQPSSDCFCVSLGGEIAFPIGDVAEWAAIFGVIQLAAN